MSEAYKQISNIRKQEQADGVLPSWMKTAGYDLFKKSYLFGAENWKEQITRIANHYARLAPSHVPENIWGTTWNEVFFKLIDQNIIVLATPTLANAGTSRGLTVSCSGQYVGDNVDSFYINLYESAILSKYGFGTSGYFGDIRHRGAAISSGGVASGVYPVMDDYWIMANKISQGGVRRGSFAGYLPISHKDLPEIMHKIKSNPDGKHLGVTITRQEANDIIYKRNPTLVENFQKLLELRMLGRGYIHFTDNVDAAQPEMYKRLGLKNHSSGLCNEIHLHQDEEHTYSCVLLSMQALTYNDWKHTNAVFMAQVFLDCMVTDFINNAKLIAGMEKIVRHTEKGRAVGLGNYWLAQLHAKEGMVYGEWDSMMFNGSIYNHLKKESEAASRWLALELGEPEWCKGTGLRNTHRLTQMPNKSSSLIFGQVSEGSNPIIGNVFNQRISTGEVFRINPNFIDLLKSKNKFTDPVLQSVADNHGSCQHLDFLSDYEKRLFRTAFEIPQHDVLSMGEQRQQFIDQGQSLNIFLPQNVSATFVTDLHIRALQSEILKGMYYVNTANANYNVIETCSSCES